MKGVFKLGLSIQGTKKLSKNYIFNCFFLISVKKGGAHKTKVLDSMLVFRCSPINSIELKSFSVPFLNKNVRNTGQRKCQKWPQFIFISPGFDGWHIPLWGKVQLLKDFYFILLNMYSCAIIFPYLYTDGDTKVQICYDIDSDLPGYFEKVALYKFNSSASTFIQIYHDLSWLVIPNFKPSFNT